MTNTTKNIRTHINNIRKITKEISELHDPPDETYEQLAQEVAWIMDNNAFHHLEDAMQHMNDEQTDVLDFIIQEEAYRFHHYGIDNNGEEHLYTVTPFAIPLTIGTSIKYKQKLESITTITDTVNAASSTRLIRKELGLSEDCTVILDNHLWRSDLKVWRRPVSIRNYLKNTLLYLANPAAFKPPLLTKEKNTNNNKIIEYNQNTPPSLYLITRNIIGTIISVNQDIDKTLFGYDDTGNIILERMYMNEIAIMCASELKKLGIPEATIYPISPLPIELWEVPENALYFQRITELRSKAKHALDLNGIPGNGFARILLFGNKEYVNTIQLRAYNNNKIKEPFLIYTWEIIHELEDPETVIDSMIRITQDTLHIYNITTDIAMS